MSKFSFDDATKALKIIIDYCNESMEEIAEELKSVKEDDLRLELMDRYAKIKQARDFVMNTLPSLLDQINAKKK